MSTIQEEIPNRFDFAQLAPSLYEQWWQDGCFRAKVDPTKKPFTIVIPPPNVTGALHLGHALNNTLQDIQIRMHRMQGFEALWMPGTDHAGIATQAVVEKRLKEIENKTRHDLGREALVDRIWKWKDEYETRILSQLQRMGCSCDWDRTRFTLDEVCARAVRVTFFDLFAKSLIFRGKRLVNWDTYLQTSVSDDEVNYETISGHFWHLRYPVIDPKPGEPTSVLVATTRPETMLGDTAVAVHPNPDQALDRAEAALREKLAAAPSKEKPQVEKELADLAQRRQDLLPQLRTLAAMARDGRRIQLPLTGRDIPLVVDEWAKPELGSGCVKITPAHDPNDYEVAIRCQLPMINIMNSDGTINEQGGRYVGMTMHKARQAVVADLEAQGLLDRVEARDIELAHSDRSKTPIEPYLTDQWFIKMEQLSQSAMDAVSDGHVEIIPSRYAKGYLDWLGEKRDWPVGRQLWWGHRIPIWTASFADSSSCESLRRKVEAMDEFTAGDLATTLESSTTLHVCIRDENSALEKKLESLGMQRQEDVLDTWFSSALWPHSTLGWPEATADLNYFYPTSTLITSRDIITLWVARMVLMGLNNMGKVPFRQVYIHPKILDGFGETMSKSKGNGVDPIDVIDKFGPDALRFGLAWLTTETQDVRMPVQYECPHCEALVNQTKENRAKGRAKCDKCKKEFLTGPSAAPQDADIPRAAVVSERFEVARNFCNKLWNASRFVMLNLEGYQPQVLDHASLPLEDQWILSRLATVNQSATQAFAEFRYADGVRDLYEFAWDQFCSFYVEMAKPRLQDPATRPVVQQVLAHTLDHLLRLLHPVTPFVTEAIWQQLARFGLRRDMDSHEECSKWIMQASWPKPKTSHIQKTIEQQFAKFTGLLGAIREIRSRQNIAPKASVQFALQCEPELQSLLKPLLPYCESMASATCREIGATVTPPKLYAQVKVEQMEVFLDLEGFLDVEAEIQRNQKLLENLIKQIQGKESKLGNESFVARAPADVVQKERESLADLIAQRDATTKALQSLSQPGTP